MILPGIRRALYRPAEPPRGLRDAAILFGVFVFAVWSGVTLCRTETNSTIFWAANGVWAAGLLLLPPRLGFGFLLACLGVNATANVLTGLPPALNVAFTALNLTLVISTAVLVRLFCGAAADLGRWNRFIRFLAIAAGLTLLEGATGAAVVAIDGPTFLSVWRRWTACDFLGLVVALPATLMMMRGLRPLYVGPARPLERVLILAVLGAGTWTALGFDDLLAYLLVYPAVVMAAFRLGSAWSFPAVWLVAQVATIRTIQGSGPLAKFDAADPLMSQLGLHFFLLSVVLASSLATSALAERLRAEQRLRRREAASAASRAHAEDAAEVRRKFLAVVSHEIRTPLNGVMGYRDALAARADLDAEARRQLDQIGRSTDALLRLVDDILDFSRIDAGRLDLDPRPADVRAALQTAVEALRPCAEAKGLDLSADLAGVDGLWAEIDAARLSQLLHKLLDNAVKFTPSGAVAVSATLQPLDGAVRLTVAVEDTGVGVPPSRADDLFKPFGQIDSSLTRRFEGAGLGLALARAVVERMDGRLGHRPRAGGGTVFWFEIDLSPVDAPAVAAAAPAEDDDRPLRVLVVDDHPVNREVARLILRAAGCDTAEAENGAEAVEAVRNGTFDAVLMDVRMPVMDGLAATRAIRALGGPAARVPIVALTADALREDVERCRAAGMDGHVAKPVNQVVLLQALFAALGAAANDDAAVRAA